MALITYVKDDKYKKEMIAKIMLTSRVGYYNTNIVDYECLFEIDKCYILVGSTKATLTFTHTNHFLNVSAFPNHEYDGKEIYLDVIYYFSTFEHLYTAGYGTKFKFFNYLMNDYSVSNAIDVDEDMTLTSAEFNISLFRDLAFWNTHFFYNWRNASVQLYITVLSAFTSRITNVLQVNSGYIVNKSISTNKIIFTCSNDVLEQNQTNLVAMLGDFSVLSHMGISDKRKKEILSIGLGDTIVQLLKLKDFATYTSSASANYLCVDDKIHRIKISEGYYPSHFGNLLSINKNKVVNKFNVTKTLFRSTKIAIGNYSYSATYSANILTVEFDSAVWSPLLYSSKQTCLLKFNKWTFEANEIVTYIYLCDLYVSGNMLTFKLLNSATLFAIASLEFDISPDDIDVLAMSEYVYTETTNNIVHTDYDTITSYTAEYIEPFGYKYVAYSKNNIITITDVSREYVNYCTFSTTATSKYVLDMLVGVTEDVTGNVIFYNITHINYVTNEITYNNLNTTINFAQASVVYAVKRLLKIKDNKNEYFLPVAVYSVWSTPSTYVYIELNNKVEIYKESLDIAGNTYVCLSNVDYFLLVLDENYPLNENDEIVLEKVDLTTFNATIVYKASNKQYYISSTTAITHTIKLKGRTSYAKFVSENDTLYAELATTYKTLSNNVSVLTANKITFVSNDVFYEPVSAVLKDKTNVKELLSELFIPFYSFVRKNLNNTYSLLSYVRPVETYYYIQDFDMIEGIQIDIIKKTSFTSVKFDYNVDYNNELSLANNNANYKQIDTKMKNYNDAYNIALRALLTQRSDELSIQLVLSYYYFNINIGDVIVLNSEVLFNRIMKVVVTSVTYSNNRIDIIANNFGGYLDFVKHIAPTNFDANDFIHSYLYGIIVSDDNTTWTTSYLIA